MRSAIRDFLISEGVAIARFRKKPVLTSYQERLRLMEENRAKPEAYRARSLRRKLTRLDRALTDQEAYALDRAYSAYLIFEGRSKSVDFGSVGGGGNGDSEPLSQDELREAGAYVLMLRRLNRADRELAKEAFAALAPWGEKAYTIDMPRTIHLARAVKNAYEQK